MQPGKVCSSKTREINKINENKSQDQYLDSSTTRQFTDMSFEGSSLKELKTVHQNYSIALYMEYPKKITINFRHLFLISVCLVLSELSDIIAIAFRYFV